MASNFDPDRKAMRNEHAPSPRLYEPPCHSAKFNWMWLVFWIAILGVGTISIWLKPLKAWLGSLSGV